MTTTFENLQALNRLATMIANASDEAMQNMNHDAVLFESSSELVFASGSNFSAHSGTMSNLLKKELATLTEANREFEMAEIEKIEF